VIRDDKLFPIFLHKVKWTLYSREEWRRARKSYRYANNPVEKAVRFFITIRQSFSKMAGSWSYAKKAVKNPVPSYFNYIDELEEIHRRLRNVQIENLDWKECARKYNSEDTFMYCLEPSTRVLTTTGLKEIQDIKQGDLVVTPKGPQPVLANLKRRINGTAIKLNIMGLGRECLVCSEEHKFYIKRNKNAGPVWLPAKEIREGYYIALGTNMQSQSFSALLVFDKSSKWSKRKILQQPHDIYKLAYLAGWFAAEGHYQNGLTFNLGIHENERAIEIKNLIRELFGIDALIKTPPHTPNESVILVRCYSRNLEDYFRQYFVGYRNELGRGAGKYLKEWILHAPPEIQINFIRGWLLGDGGLYIVNELSESASFRRKSGKRNKYKYTGTTVSETMAWQVYHMALRCGLHPCFKRRGNNKDIYFTTIADAERLLNTRIVGRVCKRRFWQNGFLWTPITKVHKIKYNGYMHDLSLPKVHSYYLYNGVLSHNCDPPYLKDVRRIKSNVYSHEFSREDHEELVEFLLNEWQGKAMLSGYKNPLYERLERAGWKRKDIEIDLRASGKPTTRNPKQRKRDKVIESVWMNYRLKTLV